MKMSLDKFKQLVQQASGGDGASADDLHTFLKQNPEYNKEPATAYVPGVEIFKVGTYRGKEYTHQDLKDMVENFKKFKGEGELNPTVAVGHDEDQSFLEDSGYPSAGLIEKLRKVGPVLVADFASVPLPWARAMNADVYNSVSSEIYDDYEGQGKTLRRVAILGAEIPQVKGLNRDGLPVAMFAEAFSEAPTYNRNPKTVAVLRAKNAVKTDRNSYVCYCEVNKMALNKGKKRVNLAEHLKVVQKKQLVPVLPAGEEFAEHKNLGEPVEYRGYMIHELPGGKFMAHGKASPHRGLGPYSSMKAVKLAVEAAHGGGDPAKGMLQKIEGDMGVHRYDEEDESEQSKASIDDKNVPAPAIEKDPADGVEEEKAGEPEIKQVDREDLLGLLADFGIDPEMAKGASDEFITDAIRVMSMLQDQAEVAEEREQKAEQKEAQIEEAGDQQGALPPGGGIPLGPDGAPMPPPDVPAGDVAGGAAPEDGEIVDLDPGEEVPTEDEEVGEHSESARQYNERIGKETCFWRSRAETDRQDMSREGWYCVEDSGQEYGPFVSEELAVWSAKNRNYGTPRSYSERYKGWRVEFRKGSIFAELRHPLSEDILNLNGPFSTVEEATAYIDSHPKEQMMKLAELRKQRLNKFAEKTGTPAPANLPTPHKTSAERRAFVLAKLAEIKAKHKNKTPPAPAKVIEQGFEVYSEDNQFFIRPEGTNLPGAGPYRSQNDAKAAAAVSAEGLRKFSEWDRHQLPKAKLAEAMPGAKLDDADRGKPPVEGAAKFEDEEGKLGKCVCSDPECPCCHGKCDAEAVAALKRIDMDDETGSPMCQDCADDAMDSGLFTIDDEEGGEYMEGYSERKKKRAKKPTKLAELTNRHKSVLVKAEEALKEARTQRVEAFVERNLINGKILPRDIEAGLKQRLLNADDKRVEKFGEKSMTAFEQALHEIESKPPQRNVAEQVKSNAAGIAKFGGDGKDFELQKIEKFAEEHEAEWKKLSGSWTKEKFAETFKKARETSPGLTAVLFCPEIAKQ